MTKCIFVLVFNLKKGNLDRIRIYHEIVLYNKEVRIVITNCIVSYISLKDLCQRVLWTGSQKKTLINILK